MKDAAPNPSLREVGMIRVWLHLIFPFALFLCFHDILLWVGAKWTNLESSYSLVILVISGYMMWCKRHSIRATAPSPNLWMGGCIVAAACILLLAGQLTQTLMIQGLALILCLLGAVLLLLGRLHLKLLLIPVAYLTFMLNFPEEVLANFSTHFQRTAAAIAASLLRLSGMPVALDRHFIELPHITLEVAKVCNGINHIVALVALSIPVGFLSPLSRWSKWLIVLSAVFVGIAANGLRVAMIGLWTKYHPGGPLHGPFDIFYVSFILISGLGILTAATGVAKLRRKPFANRRLDDRPLANKKGYTNLFSRRSLHAAFLGAGMLFAAAGYQHLFSPVTVPAPRGLIHFPEKFDGWTCRSVTDPSWPAKHLEADVEIRRVYTNSAGSQVGLYIGFFQQQRQGRELINDRLGWLHLRAEPVALKPQGLPNTIVLRGLARGLEDQTFEGDSRSFYFWYVVNDRMVLDRYAAKIYGLLDTALHRRSSGALVLVTNEDRGAKFTDADGDTLKFLEAGFPYIQNAVNLN